MATKKPPAGGTPLRVAGKRVQTFNTGVPTPVNEKKTGVGLARAMSNPGSSKRSATATGRLAANSAKKKTKAAKKRGY